MSFLEDFDTMQLIVFYSILAVASAISPDHNQFSEIVENAIEEKSFPGSIASSEP